MRNGWKIATGVLALSLMASAALAGAAPNDKAKDAPGRQKDGKAGSGVTATVTGDVYGGGTVTDSVYGHNGSKGLENAYPHVKQTPAGPRIAELLKTKYNIDVTADTDAAALVDKLEQSGNLKAAADVQAEIVKVDTGSLEGYKKLGKLKIKLGDKGVKTYVNGKEPKFDVPPVVESGRTLVPFRAIAEALEAEVSYDAKKKQVTVTRGDTVVVLTLGSKTALVDGKPVTMDVPGKLKNNRVLVPLRFLSEALQADVKWDAETSSAIIVMKPADGK